MDDGWCLGPKDVKLIHWTRTGDFKVPVTFNRYGLRDSKDFQNATEDDLFVVGDSFSFGWGVREEDRYSNVLESLLDVSVYNVSIPNDLLGYENLLQYALKNGADVRRVIVGVCMANDLKDYEADKPMYKINVNKLANIKSFFERHSAAYIALATFLHHNQTLRKLAYRLGVLERTIVVSNTNIYSEKALKSSVNKLKEMLLAFQSYILIIPSQSLWAGNNKETESKVHERFVSLLREVGLSVIDLRPIFEAGGDPLQYHFKENPHWNEKGHALAARVIAAHIGRK